MSAIAPPAGQLLLGAPALVATPLQQCPIKIGQKAHEMIKNLVKMSIMFVLRVHSHDQRRWELNNLADIIYIYIIYI